MVQARRPYCPLNGLLLLLPFAGLQDEADASQWATIGQRDLDVVRQTCRLRCPVLTLLYGLESADGFETLVRHLEPERRLRLLGQDFSLLPDIKDSQVPEMIAGGMCHFSDSLAHLVYDLFRVEGPTGPSLAEANADNTRLYEFLGAVSARIAGLEHILLRLTKAEAGAGFLIGGCFAGATGPDAERQQAFLPGVFRLLLEHQNSVAWTKDALEEEADYRRWTALGYSALACFCLVVAWLGYWRWHEIGR